MNILLLHWFVYIVLQRHLMVLWNTVWSLCDYLCPNGTVMASRISERQKLYYKTTQTLISSGLTSSWKLLARTSAHSLFLKLEVHIQFFRSPVALVLTFLLVFLALLSLNSTFHISKLLFLKGGKLFTFSYGMISKLHWARCKTVCRIVPFVFLFLKGCGSETRCMH